MAHLLAKLTSPRFKTVAQGRCLHTGYEPNIIMFTVLRHDEAMKEIGLTYG
jgi:hypothetical protein